MTGTGLACAVVAGLAVAYAVEEARRLRSGRLFHLVGRAQAVRRVFGSLVVAALMVLVFLGLEVVDPRVTPGRYLWLWGIAALVVLLLFGLAGLDLSDLRRHRDAERERERRRLESEVGMRPRSGGSKDDADPAG